MIEFLLEHDGKTYTGVYRVDDELAITVSIAGKHRRTPLVEMRPAAEAIAIARAMLDEAASEAAWISQPVTHPDTDRNLETARAFAP